MNPEKTESKPTAIDIFCGCGGLSLGFRDAGYRVLLGIDNDPVALKTYGRNFGNTVPFQLDLPDEDIIVRIKDKDLVSIGVFDRIPIKRGRRVFGYKDHSSIEPLPSADRGIQFPDRREGFLLRFCATFRTEYKRRPIPGDFDGDDLFWFGGKKGSPVKKIGGSDTALTPDIFKHPVIDALFTDMDRGNDIITVRIKKRPFYSRS